MDKKIIVISAVNFGNKTGGAVSILNQCLQYIVDSRLCEQYRVITILHTKKACPFPEIECIEYPKALSSWFIRMYYEYIYFKRLSKIWKPYLWLSLHDMTPNVVARKRAVYMHNTSVFYKWRWRDWSLDYKMSIFSMFYKYIYRTNAKKNNYLIVQQNWTRDAFSKMLNVDRKKIIVAYPFEEKSISTLTKEGKVQSNDNNTQFFYPSVPRIFKNFEVICEAVKIINSYGITNFMVNLTLNDTIGDKYSSYIYNKYKSVSNINFLGLITKDAVSNQYSQCDCLIFPSKCETWGLPVSEFIQYKKPMLLADLPYAHESSIGSQLTAFFDQSNPKDLAHKMMKIINKDYSLLHPINEIQIDSPFTKSWENLFNILLNE